MHAIVSTARPGSSSTTSSSRPGRSARAARADTRYVAAADEASRTTTGIVISRPSSKTYRSAAPIARAGSRRDVPADQGRCYLVRMDIGRVGIWTFQLEQQPAARAQAAAAEIEALGWGALWIPEALGREMFTHSALLLAGTRWMPIATGIANIWARDAMAMAAAQKTLAEAHPDRFLLGMGVSHAPMVEGMRGHRYTKPLSAMRAYLDAMDRAPFLAAPPATDPPRVIGALAPKMLALA